MTLSNNVISGIGDDIIFSARGNNGGNFDILSKLVKKASMGKRLRDNISNIGVRHWKGLQTTAKTNYTNTFNIISVACVDEFLGVRVILKNSEAVPVQVSGVIVAVTDNITNRCVPSVGNTLTNDGTTGWVQALFAGGATVTLPAGSATQPSITISDKIQLRSIPRAAGIGRPFIIARIKMVESGTFSGTFLGVGNTDTTLDTYARADSAVGDFVTTPEGMTANSGEISAGPLGGFIFTTSKNIVSGIALGSSTTQGGGSPIPVDATYRSWVPMTQELLNAMGAPVTLANYALSGTTSTQYAAIGKAAIEAHQPAFVLYPPFSTNDGTPTQAIVDAQFALAMDFAEYAMSQGCLPIFTFLCPNDSYSGTADAFRKSLIARCKATDFTVIDMSTAVGDGANPERFVSTYYVDGTHTNDLGYRAQSVIAANSILDILLRNISW